VTAIISEIFDLFERFGSQRYGEEVSLESHLLQSAALAESMGAPASAVAAALLHDIGHFLYDEGEAPAGRGRDMEHEALGAVWLSRAFVKEVTGPIALHVSAKRYLCAVEPGYFERLSEASRLSLVAQGGIMNDEEAAAFAKEPAFEAALLVRRCDDRGKDLAMATKSLERYRGLLEQSLRQPG